MKQESLSRENILSFASIAAFLVSLCLGSAALAVSDPQTGVWEIWSSESYTMAPRESFQLRTAYSDMKTRRWMLVVDGGDANCDLSVLRVNGEELLYYKIDENHHEVSIPWGEGEELIMVLTNRDEKGAFVVSLMGPPKGQNTASYSYPVNRALEAYSAGLRLKARDLCHSALKQNPNDGVAKVLLAGFLREGHRYEESKAMAEDAMESDLDPAMKSLAEGILDDLKVLLVPLPAPVREGLASAEESLENGEPEKALKVCNQLLDGDINLKHSSQAKLQVLRGRALQGVDRDFEAIDAFTRALTLDRAKASQAQAYFYMGHLYVDMGNLAQAEGSLSMAINNGLPSGLDVQARETLKVVTDRLDQDR
ncbi:MAG: hypothetical protein GY780_04030 [bacterium]|nr:hypothetical protein [bacterium]